VLRHQPLQRIAHGDEAGAEALGEAADRERPAPERDRDDQRLAERGIDIVVQAAVDDVAAD